MNRIELIFKNVRYKNLKWIGIGCIRKIFSVEKSLAINFSKPKKKHEYRNLMPYDFGLMEKINTCNRSVNLNFLEE